MVPSSLHSLVIAVFAGSLTESPLFPDQSWSHPLQTSDAFMAIKEPELHQRVEEVADSNCTASGCAPFRHAAAPSVSVEELQTRRQMLNEDGRLIGHGHIVDCGAVEAWRVAAVSESEPLPPDRHHLLMGDHRAESLLPESFFLPEWSCSVLLVFIHKQNLSLSH